MIKNALLSLKKNIGKTILLFVIIVVITNLVIAGLSMQSATQKSMDQIRCSLGNDVTLSVDFRNMMKNREPGAAVSNETSLTTTMADSLKNLKYVESYNYQISTSADSDSISAVDAKKDAMILESLIKSMAGTTVILIAHRITTLMQADCIMVLEDGAVAEMGSHEQLMEHHGIYRRIYDIQMNTQLDADSV